MSSKRILGLILLIYIALGSTYAIVTPVFEASDELWHYPMVRHLADGNPLPVQVFDPDLAGPWKQEASQPPLYYYLGAALTFWIDTSDMEQVRWLNPHVDNGVITEDGNNNLAIHDPAADPWQGTLLAVHVVRLFSVLLGAVTVYATFRIAQEIVPDRPEIGLGAAATTAFMPMFLFISGAVNNDNLAVALASLSVWLMIRSVKAGPSLRIWLGQGVLIGLALLTKEGTFALLPLAFGTVVVTRWRHTQIKAGQRAELDAAGLARMLGRSLLDFALLMIPVLLIAGWWYWRNVRLYGDLLGWNAFIAVLGQRAQPASLAQLWDERRGFLMSYWGLFGGVNVPMPLWIYAVLNSVMAASVVGFFVYAFVQLKELHQELGRIEWRLMPAVHYLMSAAAARFGLLVCLLFALAVVYGLVQWATTTWSSQGRLVFTAISSLNILMMLGLAGWQPRRIGRWAAGGTAVFMLVVGALAPFMWIRPVYQPQTYQAAASVPTQPVNVEFVDQGGSQLLLRLTSFGIAPVNGDSGQVRPGDWIEVAAEWQVLAPVPGDWSIFLHVNDPVLGVPVAQRDMYHGQGLRPTSLLKTNEQLTTYFRLQLPATAPAPADFDVSLGLYDFRTGQRLRTTGGSDTAVLDSVTLQPRPGENPNPLSVDFGGEIELVGYEVDPRLSSSGGLINLTLYWRAQKPLETDYKFFSQVVGEDSTRWAASDLPPDGGTSAAEVGRVYALEMPLRLAADVPSAVYPIHVGLYTQGADGTFSRLQLVTEDGRITQDDFLLLTKVRVD